MKSLVKVISNQMWSHFNVPFHSHTSEYQVKIIIGYSYHSVTDISFGLAQSDHIKQLLLYNAMLILGFSLSSIVDLIDKDFIDPIAFRPCNKTVFCFFLYFYISLNL